MPPHKGFKDAVQAILRNADPAIAYVQHGLTPSPFERQPDLPTRLRELDGILEKVGDYLVQATFITINEDGPLGERELQRMPLFLERMIAWTQRLARTTSTRSSRSARNFEEPSIDAHDVEQLVHKTVEPL